MAKINVKLSLNRTWKTKVLCFLSPILVPIFSIDTVSKWIVKSMELNVK